MAIFAPPPIFSMPADHSHGNFEARFRSIAQGRGRGTMKTNFSQNDLKQLTYQAIKACRQGRDILLHYSGRLKQVTEKFQAGLVSEADQESESAIKSFLRAEFPDFDFLGEESAGVHPQEFSPSSKPRWILDPLDGTTNYVHGLPVYAVSLGLELQGEVYVGVVEAPALHEVYTAWKGGGAFCNGQPLKVSNSSELSRALLATGFISDFEDQLEEQLKIFSLLVRRARGIRRAGAAAMDLAWVARGVFDGYWERNLKPWDLAAGLLLVQEAGGRVTSYRGVPCTPYAKSVVAGNPTINQAIVTAIGPDLRPETV
ncbi:MAG: inositol monophosphatase [Bdellovibrio sp.]|nr:MAG: inositol monophosphatase [Bdellovibrio sp.]